MPDPSHQLNYEELQIEPDHTFREQPVRILDQRMKVLKKKEIQLVLVQWSHRSAEEATWEVADQMKESYPKVFEDLVRSFEVSF